MLLVYHSLKEEKMKKFVLFCAFLTFFGSLFAVEDTSLLQGDETVKIYERKAVMGFEDIGFQQNEISAAMVYCESNGKNMNCIPWSVMPVVKIPITNDSKAVAAKNFYEWTITNRMDKIIMGDGRAYVMTRGSEIGLDIHGIPVFVSGTNDLSAFQSNVEKYLNGDVKGVFGALLDASLEARYTELPEKEQETFITTKAKELGISADFASRLMSSSFVFAAHVQSVGGAGQIIHAKIDMPKIPGMKALPTYTAVATLSVNVDFLIYHYNFETKQFELYKKIVGKSGVVTEQKTSAVVPEPGMVTKAFNKAFKTAIKAASISANYELKKDDNFALFTPVKNVENGKKIETSMGVMEDIRVDHPFSINETVDGKRVNKGWARARKIAKNCSEDCSETTLIKVTNGEAEEGDLLREHPWTGVFFNLGIGTNATKITGKKKVTIDGEEIYAEGRNNGSMFAAPGLHAGLTFDLGYMLNSAAASEFYLNFFFDFDYDINDGLAKSLKTKSTNGLAWFGGGFGIAKRFYGSSNGFFFAPALDIEARGGWGSGEYKYDMVTFIAKPHFQFGWSVNPNFDFIIKAGWNVGGLLQVKEKGEGYEADILKEYSQFAHGLFFTFDFDFHLPIVGMTAKMFKAPSKACPAKKQEKVEESGDVKENSEESAKELGNETAEDTNNPESSEEDGNSENDGE